MADFYGFDTAFLLGIATLLGIVLWNLRTIVRDHTRDKKAAEHEREIEEEKQALLWEKNKQELVVEMDRLVTSKLSVVQYMIDDFRIYKTDNSKELVDVQLELQNLENQLETLKKTGSVTDEQVTDMQQRIKVCEEKIDTIYKTINEKAATVDHIAEKVFESVKVENGKNGKKKEENGSTDK